ncbi:MAG TPA: helix-turn-helix domain-containing protein [Vicinamibacterales bacterium]|nr:helix-turn-helix domain-containing protein [Vicinamibacterales bacterium]
MATRVSLAELAAAGFVLHPSEAAAVVVDLCRQLDRGSIRGIPSTHVIRLTPDGAVIAEGPITTDRPPIAKAAQLLNDLLPPFDAPPPYRVPGGLRLVVARALGTLDVPPFESLDEFCAAISRFAAGDLSTAARNLYRAREIANAPRVLTISDVRRARRATGLSLEDISSACGVSAALLRELEWGYLKNWRKDGVGRSWLSGYAKASGLDEELVTSIVVPMFEEETEEQDGVALVTSGPQALVPVAPAIPAPPRRWWMLWAAASAASIALLTVVVTMAWPRSPTFAEATAGRSLAVSNDDVALPIDRVQKPAEPPDVRAVQMAPAAKPHVAKARSAAKRPAAAPLRKPPSKPSFFKRELLRIVIR